MIGELIRLLIGELTRLLIGWLISSEDRFLGGLPRFRLKTGSPSTVVRVVPVGYVCVIWFELSGPLLEPLGDTRWSGLFWNGDDAVELFGGDGLECMLKCWSKSIVWFPPVPDEDDDPIIDNNCTCCSSWLL